MHRYVIYQEAEQILTQQCSAVQRSAAQRSALLLLFCSLCW
jgi:hypothetical protein